MQKAGQTGPVIINNRSFQLYSLLPVPTLLRTEAQMASMHVLKRGESLEL